jgi:hypothetical protein
MLNENIISDSVIIIDGNIYLSNRSIIISNIVSLIIEGNGFKVDGQGLVGCFTLHNATSIRMHNLMVVGGGTGNNAYQV